MNLIRTPLTPRATIFGINYDYLQGLSLMHIVPNRGGTTLLIGWAVVPPPNIKKSSKFHVFAASTKATSPKELD
jgi:hypothetical protein